MKAMLVLIWLMFSLVSMQGRDLYVDNVGGHDANSGQSSEQALATLAKASGLVEAGDTLHIINNGKDYRESLRIVGRSGTPQAPIVVKGNGAILCGLEKVPASDWQREGQLWSYTFPHKLSPNCTPILRVDGQYVTLAEEDTPPLDQYIWKDGVLMYRTDATPTTLEVSRRDSGVQLYNASYIIVQDIICEGFYNDGGNYHGDCRGLEMVRMESRHNGDDGFSAHEDVTASFRNCYSHHNGYGIQDICSSQTEYHGVVVSHNRLGVGFFGGLHRLVDCEIRDNAGYQVCIERGSPSGGVYGTSDAGSFYAGICFLKRTTISGGTFGIRIGGRSRAYAMEVAVSGSDIGILVQQGGELELRHSRVEACRDAELDVPTEGLIQGDNVFSPGRFIAAGKQFGPPEWSAFLTTIGSPPAKSTVEP